MTNPACIASKDLHEALALDELLKLNGQAFIEKAYQIILNREADIEGIRYYVNRLRLGFSKNSLIYQLCMSSEGRLKMNDIPGLEAVVKLQQQLQHPLIGWLHRIKHPNESNNLKNRTLRAIENNYLMLNDGINYQIDKTKEIVVDSIKESTDNIAKQIHSQNKNSNISLLESQSISLTEKNIYNQFSSRTKSNYRKLKLATARSNWSIE